MLLASIGIYGVTAYGTSRQTNEFGVRMALGADRRHVLWLVLGETARLGVTGVVIGLLLALAAGRFVSSLLFGLTPVAGYVPALRATRIDPLLALRRERWDRLGARDSGLGYASSEPRTTSPDS